MNQVVDQRKNMIVKDLLKRKYDQDSTNQASHRLNLHNRNSSTNRSSALDFSEQSVSTTTKNEHKSKIIFNNDDL